ncbi:glutaredoxin family protein [Acidihalobacter ferrooxydans]|uniref:Glutaredoxin n=1 Tax=Acidihalobacter ferrooxydans TaxID=1765967 RepID=A0A1P8UJL8_9GAMM|nr:glutathione S-transferase N-terminal domain-containing protein [Acidihalobacter ferrooxydans]APZ44037.1 glutaredoxin [Acidihalobacter ferrooxydans]
MKPLIRLFFRTVRLVLSPVMIMADRMTTPKGIVRTPQAQAAVEEATARLALYHFQSCPFCIKTRREMARLSLPIELRDAQHDAARREELLQGGGEVKVPCLRIEDDNGDTRWMYESERIIAYLHERFDAPETAPVT